MSFYNNFKKNNEEYRVFAMWDESHSRLFVETSSDSTTRKIYFLFESLQTDNFKLY